MSGNASRKDGAALNVEDDVSVQEVGPLAGRLGLKNMGNTCFMNAGLQCIAHLEPLAQYFLRGGFEKDRSGKFAQHSAGSEGANADTKGEQRGELTYSFTALLRQLWQCDRKKAAQKCKNILPKNFYDTFKQLQPFLFEDEQQQDVQEFIGFCLEGLNDELNRVSDLPSNPTDAQLKEDERLGNEEGDDFAAALSWHRHLEREKSFLVDLLQGQQRSSVTCQECGHMSRKFEPFMHLSIPVEKNMNCLTDGILKYLEEEKLSGQEQWFCETCKKKVDAKKKIDLWFLPPVLILHLKRFDSSLTKIDKRLHMPVYGFDLSKCCSKPQKDGAVYDVSCVANHQGAYGSGHYTAVCRVGPPSSGTWHMYDDEEVSELKNTRSVATKAAYVVFLVRKGEDDLGATFAKARTQAPAVQNSQPLLRKRTLPRCQSISNPDDWPHALEPAVKAREVAAQSASTASRSSSGDSLLDTGGQRSSSSSAATAPSPDGKATLSSSTVARASSSRMEECTAPVEKPHVIGQKVQCHDGGGVWQEGFVTGLDPLLVTCDCKDPQAKGFECIYVRHIPEPSEQGEQAAASGSPVSSANPGGEADGSPPQRHAPEKKEDLQSPSSHSGSASPSPKSDSNKRLRGKTADSSVAATPGLSDAIRNVFTPARRSRSVSDAANESLPMPKRQRSISDFFRSSSAEAKEAPTKSKTLLNFFQRR